MTDSRAKVAIDAIAERLRAIKVADGFNTDAGERVYLGPYWPSSGVDAVVATFSQEQVQGDSGARRGGSYQLQRQFSVTGLIKSETNTPKGSDLERLLADVKRALFILEPLADRQFGPLLYVQTQMNPRVAGNEYESFDLTCALNYMEAYGDPYAVK
jgi:hypothetical protein